MAERGCVFVQASRKEELECMTRRFAGEAGLGVLARALVVTEPESIHNSKGEFTELTAMCLQDMTTSATP